MGLVSGLISDHYLVDYTANVSDSVIEDGPGSAAENGPGPDA